MSHGRAKLVLCVLLLEYWYSATDYDITCFIM